VFENKRSREIIDSALIMISTTYDLRCETFRFASRKIRFVFAVFGPVQARNETAGRAASSRSDRHREERSDAAIQRMKGGAL
jgi:hypothetical protein